MEAAPHKNANSKANRHCSSLCCDLKYFAIGRSSFLSVNAIRRLSICLIIFLRRCSSFARDRGLSTCGVLLLRPLLKLLMSLAGFSAKSEALALAAPPARREAQDCKSTIKIARRGERQDDGRAHKAAKCGGEDLMHHSSSDADISCRLVSLSHMARWPFG